MVCLQTYLLLLLLILNVGGDTNQQKDDDWIDPFDMVNFDHSTKTMTKEVVKETEKVTSDKPKVVQDPSMVTTTTPTPTVVPVDLKSTTEEKIKSANNNTCKKHDVGTVILKKFLRQMLIHFKEKHPQTSSSQEYNMFIYLSKRQIDLLTKYVHSTKDISIHDVDEVLSSMIHSIALSHRDTIQKTSMWLEDRIGISLDSLLKVLAVMTLASILTTVEINLHIPLRQRVVKLFILAFIISLPMTWYELYKGAKIKQETIAMKDAPSNCMKNADEKGWFDTMKGVFTFEKDECQEYYEHVLIDPMFKIPPTKVVSITFARFFISPLKDIGGALSEFLRALFKDLPTTFYPVAIAVLSIVIFLFLFMWFGYSVRLPFFLGSIEPTYNPAISDGSVRAAIEDNTRQIMEQMKALQNDVQSTDQALTDRMVHLEKVQKAAIEYTAAVSTTNAGPPTLRPVCSDTVLHSSLQSIVEVPRVRVTESNKALANVSDDIVKAKTKTKSPIPCTETTFDVISSSELLGACSESPDTGVKTVIDECSEANGIYDSDISIETLPASSLSSET